MVPDTSSSSSAASFSSADVNEKGSSLSDSGSMLFKCASNGAIPTTV